MKSLYGSAESIKEMKINRGRKSRVDCCVKTVAALPKGATVGELQLREVHTSTTFLRLFEEMYCNEHISKRLGM